MTSLFPFKDYDKMALDAFLEKEDAVIFLRTHISEQGNADPYLSHRVRYLGNEQAEDIMDIADIFDILITIIPVFILTICFLTGGDFHSL